MRHLRIGVVGQSLEGALLAQSFEQLHGVESVAVQAPDDPQEFLGILRSARVNALVVCAPVNRRIYLVRKALDEGLPVLAETPMATELESLASLLEERAQRPGPPLIPITPWRFAPDLQLARGILSGGALGDPTSFEITMPGPGGVLLPNTKIETPVSAAAIIMHQGWVALDLVRHLLGDVASLQATRIRSSNAANPSLEGVELTMRCANGWNGRVRLAVEPATPGAQWVRLTGDEGAVELGWHSSSFISSLGERARIGQGCFDMDNYERLANAFADVAAKRVNPWINDADLARTLELVQTAHMSLGAGLAVEAPRRQRRIVAA